MKNTKSIFMLPAFILAAVFSVNFISKDYTNAEWPVHITDNSDKAPEIKAEKWINSDNVKANVKELGIEYPMATDNAFYNWYNYDVHAQPTIFLIDKRGEIRYQKAGEGNYKKTEEKIKELLEEQI